MTRPKQAAYKPAGPKDAHVLRKQRYQMNDAVFFTSGGTNSLSLS